MDSRVPWRRRLGGLAWTVGWFVLWARVWGLRSAVAALALGVAFWVVVPWHVKRQRRLHPDEPFPAPEAETPPIELPVAPNRVEAALLLLSCAGGIVFATSMLASWLGDVALGLVRGPDHSWDPDWLLWGMTPAAVAPFTFLGYALLVSRRARRAGEPDPPLGQFAGRAAIRAAIDCFRPRSAVS